VLPRIRQRRALRPYNHIAPTKKAALRRPFRNA